MLKVTVLVVCLAGAWADLRGLDIPTGTCLCINSNNIHVRESPCGEIVSREAAGTCLIFEGIVKTCQRGERTITTYELGGGWVEAQYLNTANLEQCDLSHLYDMDLDNINPDELNCGAYQTVNRAGWNARAPRNPRPLNRPVANVFIHHTVSSHCTSQAACSAIMRNMQTYHMDSRGFSDIGYSWVVGEDGRAYEGRGWMTLGAHTGGFNSCGTGIAVIGNFMSRAPNAAAINTVRNLIACGVSGGHIRSAYRLHGHRQAGATACPGDSFYNVIRTWPRWDSGSARC